MCTQTVEDLMGVPLTAEQKMWQSNMDDHLVTTVFPVYTNNNHIQANWLTFFQAWLLQRALVRPGCVILVLGGGVVVFPSSLPFIESITYGNKRVVFHNGSRIDYWFHGEMYETLDDSTQTTNERKAMYTKADVVIHVDYLKMPCAVRVVKPRECRQAHAVLPIVLDPHLVPDLARIVKGYYYYYLDV